MTTICISPINSLKTFNKSGISTINNDDRPFGLVNSIRSSPNSNFGSLKVKAVDNRQTTKTSSIVCEKCDGNGAVLCTQCKGTGVNAVDHFNGQFKAGSVCWLCRGKREILCGNCNGAGFVGGFMSTQDD